MKKLNKKTVPLIPDRPIKIIQFGEGNFLRGFVDWMMDILNEKTEFNGNVQIVQPLERGMGKSINDQDGLYHVLLEGIERGEKIQKTRLITSVSGVSNPYEDYQGFLRLGENPYLEFIFSNTTEAGIQFDENDIGFDKTPNSFPGKLTAMLYHRFQYFDGHPPTKLVIVPCELIEKNGEKLKECLLNYVEHWSLPTSFKVWVERSILFCNSLVDRIVPGFPKDQIDKIQERIGYEDNLVVKAEPFHLWVIQGPEEIKQMLMFKNSGLNVVLTNNLEPYRTRKVRILNGIHTAMVPIAYLNGFEEVRDVVEDEEMGAFLNQIMFEEIISTLDLPQEELETYAHEVIERFRNPFINHRLLDISLNSVAKFKVRVLPSIFTYLEKYQKIPKGLMTAFAHLILFYSGKHNAITIPINDDKEVIAFFQMALNMGDLEQGVKMILSNEDLWGTDLNEKTMLSEFLKETVKAIANNQYSSR